jgi:hypothetical protein
MPSRRTLSHSYDDLEPTTMIPPKPTEILDAEDAEARLLSCLEHLAEVLAVALALERDPVLRAAVAGAV